jgi:hypothetical protein
MALYTVHNLSMAATAYTPWVDVRRLAQVSIQTDCGDVNDPVGVVTLESTNDIATVEKEQNNGTTPANSAAAKLTLATASSSGTNWATGFDGVGAKSAVLISTTVPSVPFVRVKYTRTSGGAADTLVVRWFGQLRYA